jgi:erythronate-4-phosphate dehydrogenase
MRIIADENIPLLQEYFSVFGEVLPVNGRNLRREQLSGADILLVRSVTPVNADLLDETPVRFVGTCTIGTDHLDTAYLGDRHIAHASAPGCNAGGVAQYVLTAVTQLRPAWRTLKIGVIGCGNVGGRLVGLLRKLGVDCIGYDPFLTTSDDLPLVSFDEVLASDVICMHTPLTRSGPHPTEHLIDRIALKKLRPGALLLNAGRGGAVDNAALLAHLESGADLQVVLDVWENEPAINPQLAREVAIGTPHIAGYSSEGRTNGSAMICRELANFLGWPKNQIDRHLATIAAEHRPDFDQIYVEDLEQALGSTYDLEGDHGRLLAAVNSNGPLGLAFDSLRKHYPERHEPFCYSIVPTRADSQMLRELEVVGFQVKSGG